MSNKYKNKSSYDEDNYTTTRYTKSKNFKNAYELLELFTYAIIAVLFIFTFFARLTIVDGNSMDDTLENKDYLVVANVFFTYEPDNGDIVVVHGDFGNYYKEKYNDININTNSYPYTSPLVKRVIATEGQEIKIVYELSKMLVYVDGQLLEEEYAKYVDRLIAPTLGEYLYDENGNPVLNGNGEPIYKTYLESGVFTATVPEGHVFVMGDNRNHSADSRVKEIGFVPKEFIVGKAVFRLMPFNKIGGL